MYASALTESAIQKIYNETKTGTEQCVDSLSAGLVAHYEFEGNANDSTVFANTVTQT